MATKTMSELRDEYDEMIDNRKALNIPQWEWMKAVTVSDRMGAYTTPNYVALVWECDNALRDPSLKNSIVRKWIGEVREVAEEHRQHYAERGM